MEPVIKEATNQWSQNTTTPLWLLGALLGIVLVSGGASCGKKRTLAEFAPPVVFEEPPTLAELSEKLNHSLKIQQLQSNTLTIRSDEITIDLKGDLLWQRPDNFRLEAYPVTRMAGVVFAAGSNSEMFWLQTQFPPPPTLVFANHREFEAQQGPRKTLPVSPLWLSEALGIIDLNPNLPHTGPVARSDGLVQIETTIPTKRGAYRRVLVVEPVHVTVEQTLLYDATNKLVAQASQSEHSYYNAIELSLPHRVDIQLHPDVGPTLAFTVEVGFYMFNESASASPEAFDFPDSTGLTTHNLVQLNGQTAAGVPVPPVYREARRPQPADLQSFGLVR